MGGEIKFEPFDIFRVPLDYFPAHIKSQLGGTYMIFFVICKALSFDDASPFFQALDGLGNGAGGYALHSRQVLYRNAVMYADAQKQPFLGRAASQKGKGSRALPLGSSKQRPQIAYLFVNNAEKALGFILSM